MPCAGTASLPPLGGWATLEPNDLLVANEHLRRSNPRWKALALAACSALVFVVFLGFAAMSAARTRAMEAVRAERQARDAANIPAKAANPGQQR